LLFTINKEDDVCNKFDGDKLEEEELDDDGIDTINEIILDETPFNESNTLTQQSNLLLFEDDPNGNIESTNVNSDCFLKIFLPFDK